VYKRLDQRRRRNEGCFGKNARTSSKYSVSFLAKTQTMLTM
jgi:hypothetical protein